MHSITPRKKGRPPALTQKQKKFAELYVWDRGKKTLSQCAFEAGYKNRPSETASDLRNPRKYPLVCEHIRKLENERVIKGYFADIDPEKVGFNLTAIINLRIKKGTLIDVQDSIAKHSRVFGVYDVTGEWDSLILARFQNREEMDKFIKTTLSQKYIERTSTSLVLNTVKEEPRVLL